MAELRQKCCHQTGFCYIEENHPRLEDFDCSFGTSRNNIQHSDIDGVVEVDGYFLFKEFKSHYNMSDAQRKMYERLSKLSAPDSALDGTRVVVMYIVGDAAKRHSEAYCLCINGQWTPWTACTYEQAIEKSSRFMLEAKARELATIRANLSAARNPS